MNGRELRRTERDYVVSLLGGDATNPGQYAGSYELDASGNLTRNRMLLGNLVQAQQRRSAAASSGGGWYSKGGAYGNSAPGCSYVYIPNSTTGGSTSVTSGCD